METALNDSDYFRIKKTTNRLSFSVLEGYMNIAQD